MIRSIRGKIFASHLGMTAVIALTVGASGYYLMKGHLKDAQLSKMEIIADYASKSVQRFLHDKAALMKRITESPEFEDYHDKYRDLPLARHFAKFKNEIPVLSYINKEGREEVKTIYGKLSRATHNHKGKLYIRDSLSSPNQVKIRVDRGCSELRCATIIMTTSKFGYFGDTFQGILIGHIPLSKITDLILDIKVGETGSVILIDEEGAVLAHRQKSRILTKITGQGVEAERMIQEATGMEKGVARAALFGMDAFIVYAPIDSMKWSVLVTLPYEEFIQAPNRLRNFTFLAVFTIFIVGSWIAAAVTKGITSPLAKLVSASRTVAKGSLSQIVNKGAMDEEIETLVGSFNMMVSELSNTLISKKYVDSIFESMADSMMILDKEGKVKKVNGATLNLLGYSERELISKPADKLFVQGAGYDKVWKTAFRKLTDGRRVEAFEATYITKHNVEIPVILSGSLLNDGNNDEQDITVIAKDITDRKKYENNLRAFASKLEQRNDDLQEFIKIASHDLQEPLRKIIAFADRLMDRQEGNLTEQGKTHREKIQNAVRRMQILISDLLTFSRITTKANPFSPVDLVKTVREVLSDLKVKLEQTGGRVEVGDLPHIEADPLQIRQLFQNLIGNALKFSKKEVSPVVRVSSRIVDGQHESSENGFHAEKLCQITVEDNGVGFDEKYLDRIFAVFQRLHGLGKYEGTGMGLAISRKIVERHGGSITAKSAPGEGATFIIRLPVKQPKGEQWISAENA